METFISDPMSVDRQGYFLTTMYTALSFLMELDANQMIESAEEILAQIKLKEEKLKKEQQQQEKQQQLATAESKSIVKANSEKAVGRELSIDVLEALLDGEEEEGEEGEGEEEQNYDTRHNPIANDTVERNGESSVSEVALPSSLMKEGEEPITDQHPQQQQRVLGSAVGEQTPAESSSDLISFE